MRVGFTLRGVGGLGGGGWRGGYRGWRAEGLQARVDSGAGAGLRGGGGRRRDAAAHGTAVTAVATDFGTVLGQPLRSSHSSQHPHWTDKALLVRGQQRGSRWRRSLLRWRRGGVRLHLAAPAHYRAWPVIGRCHGNNSLSLGLAHGARSFDRAVGTICSPGGQRQACCLRTSHGGDSRR